jgi:hypothetical protein
MKVYVTGYLENPEYKESMKAGKPFQGEFSHTVFYGAEPRWTLPTKHLAEHRLGELQFMKIRGGSRHCQLEVEQVGEEKFAIVCNDHPTGAPE